MSDRFDCAIVGAGMAGTALALALARLDLDVVVIDAREPLTAEAVARDVRGLVLAPATQWILSEIGVWPAIAEFAEPIRYVDVSDRGHFAAARLTHEDLGLPALGHVCPGGRVLAALEQALAAEPRCTVAFGATLERLEVDTAAARLALSTGGVRRELRAALLVGADGTDSRVRAYHGIGVRRRDYGQTAIVATVDVARWQPYTAFERFTSDGPFAILPLGGSRHVVVRSARTVDADALLGASDADFCADLAARAGGRFGRFFNPGPRRGYPLVATRAERITAPRTVLVGNAANTLHPNGAQGLNLGLRDCAALAAAARDALANATGLGSPEMLAAYRKARASDHLAIARFTDGVARVFGTEFGPAVLLRGAALLACDLLPPLRRRLLDRLTGLGELARGGALAPRA